MTKKDKTYSEESSKAFYDAVANGQLDKVLNLIEKDQVNISWANPKDGYKTALHLAAESANPILLALLIGKGCDICMRDESGRTPLTLALESGNKEIIHLLANRTVSSLEEAHTKIKSSKFGANTSTMNRLLHHREMYRSPSDNNMFDVADVSNHMDKILEVRKPQGLFNCHVPRESAITDMLNISHFQTIYNIFVAVFFISLLNTLVHNYYDSGTPLDFSVLFWCFGGFPFAFVYWMFMCCCSFVVVLLQKAIINKTLSPRVAFWIYLGLQIANFFGTPNFIRENNFGPATNTFVMCECVRLVMKTHSYMMNNHLLRIARESGDKDPMVKEYPKNISFWDYARFLMFPTLIYQTSYPRTKSIRWGFVIKCFGEVGLCILYIYAILVRYCTPHLNEFIGDYKSLILGVFKVMLPGIGISVLSFFMILHSWMNGFAELTRFADRYFYSDWWNATSWSTYYRKWNFVVHNFIHRHVFTELLLMNYSKTTAMWLTFIISAIIHEYIIAAALGFYKPILLIMFLIPGVLFIYLTKLVGKGSRGWNVFMWAMLIVGHGMLVGLYSRAWHKHYYTPNEFYDNYISLIWIL